MSLLGSDVNQVVGRERMLLVANPHQAAPSDADYHVSVAMAFQAGIATWFQFEVPEMKRDPLAALANQHLARGAGEFPDSASRNLVRFNLGVFPTEIAPKTLERRRRCTGCRCARNRLAGSSVASCDRGSVAKRDHHLKRFLALRGREGL